MTDLFYKTNFLVYTGLLKSKQLELLHAMQLFTGEYNDSRMKKSRQHNANALKLPEMIQTDGVYSDRVNLFHSFAYSVY